MPKTPLQAEVAKPNPYITKGISKKFLTPCRQVGLSRKKKTPNSTNNSCTESIKSSFDTTPVSSIEPLNKIDHEIESKTSLEKIKDDKPKRKNKVSKRLITDDDDESVEGCVEIIKDEKPERKKVSKCLITNDNADDESVEEGLEKIKDEKPNRKNKVSKHRITDDDEPVEDSLERVKNEETKRKNKVSKRLISDDDDDEPVEDSDVTHANKKICNNLRDVDKELTSADSAAFPEKISMKNSDEIKSNPRVKFYSSEASVSEVKAQSKSKTKSRKSPKKSKKIAKNSNKYDNTSTEKNSETTDTRIIEEKSGFDCEEKRSNTKGRREIIDHDYALCKKKDQNIPEHVTNPIIKEWDITATLDHSKDKSKEKLQEMEEKTLNGKKQNKSRTLAVEDKNKKEVLNKSEVAVLKDVTNEEEISKTFEKVKPTNSLPVNNIKASDKNKKIKRSLSMKRSSSDDKDHKFEGIFLKECSINLGPCEDKYIVADLDSKSLPNEIKNLQKQIKEKQKLVDELKQAEIYKKKHNVKELAALTAIYKTGCISALNDLLPLLQQHGNMDMAKLLSNLGVPEDKLTLSPDGDLI